MNIFTVFMFASIGLSFIVKPRRGEQRKKIFCICESVMLILIAALRSNYTEDMTRYAANFADIAKHDWISVFREQSHVGLYIFVKMISYISTDIRFIYGILGAVFALAIGILIYENSKEPLLSYVILVPMGYFAFALTGIAQGLAMSLLIFGYLFLQKKRYLLYFLCVALAAVCHTTALIGLVLIVLSKLKFNKLSICAIIVCYIMVYLNKNLIGTFLVEQIGYREYEVKMTNGGIGELIIYLSILIVAILLLYHQILNNENIRFCFWSCFIGAGIFMFVPVLTEFFRLAMYFNIFIILLIPEIIAKVSSKDTKQGLLVRFGIYFCLFVVYFGFTYVNSSMDMYTFFWDTAM